MPRPLPPSRTLRIAKWTGLGVYIQTMVVWWVTEYNTISYRTGSGKTSRIAHGNACVEKAEFLSCVVIRLGKGHLGNVG